MTQTANIVRFPYASRFAGYGYDFARERVLSFNHQKTHPEGYALQRRASYTILGRGHAAIRHDVIRHHADVERKAIVTSNVLSQAMTPAARGIDRLNSIRPSYPYVLYSKKNQCSQYFFSGTSLADAFARLAKRGEVVEIADARILNVNTGEIKTVTAKTVVTEYSLT